MCLGRLNIEGGVLKRGGVANDMGAVQWLSVVEVPTMNEIDFGLMEILFPIILTYPKYVLFH